MTDKPTYESLLKENVALKIELSEKRDIENSLKESELRFRSIIENSPDAIMLTDYDGTILECNQSVENLIKIPLSEILNQKIWDIQFKLIPQEKRTQEKYDNYYETFQKIYSGEIELPSSKNNYVLNIENKETYIEQSYFKIKTAQGFRIASISRDITQLHLAQKALKESEELWRLSYEYSAIGICLVDKNGRFTWTNPAFENMLGYSKEEVLNLEFNTITHPDDKLIGIDALNKIVLGELKNASFEKRYIHKNGSIVWVSVTTTLVSRLNEPSYFISQIADISTRKQDELKLKESEEKYKELFEANTDGITIFKINENEIPIISDMNEGAAKLLGYTKNELFNLNPHEIEIETNQQKLEMRIHDLKTKGFSHFETIFRHKNGHSVFVEVKALLIKHQNQLTIMNIVRDISERKQIEQALKESEQKFKTYILSSPNSIFIADKNGRYVFANPAVCKLLKYSYDEILRMGIPDILPEEGIQKGIESFRELNEKGKVSDFEFQIKRNDGELVNVVLDGVKISDNEYIAYVKDLTEIKHAELIIKQQNEELTKLNLDKDRFISILAHDLKNPFNTLFGFSELLLKNLRKYEIERIEKQLKTIHHVSKQTYDLLEDLLLWSKSHAGKLNFAPQVVLVKDICKDLIQNSINHANTKDISIEYFETQPVQVFADINMFKTILRNLITNAIKFTNENGQIQIHAENMEHQVLITITDNGIGISPMDLSKIWETTYPISTFGTSGEKGTGFGLLLCKEFVEKHNGKIWAESEEGKGSKFMFSIPDSEKNL